MFGKPIISIIDQFAGDYAALKRFAPEPRRTAPTPGILATLRVLSFEA